MLSDQQMCEARECVDDATGFDSYMKMWFCDHHGGREDAAPVVTSSDVERAATLAWNEAIEAAAETADGGPLRVRGVLMKPSERIRALKRAT